MKNLETIAAETLPETLPETLKEAETMFPKLRAAVNRHFDTEADLFAESLTALTAAEALKSWYYTERMTPAARRLIEATDPAEALPEAARLKMVKRFERYNEKRRAEYLGRLDRAEAAAPLTAADIVVTWAKNRTWGMNPTAEVMTGTVRTTGTASGCGYDKESAAIAEAFNRHPSVMRALYEHAEKGGLFAYSVYQTACVPWFDGGCGVSCFRSVFEGLGYKWEDVSHRRGSFDVYRLTRNA